MPFLKELETIVIFFPAYNNFKFGAIPGNIVSHLINHLPSVRGRDKHIAQIIRRSENKHKLNPDQNNSNN
jgi:hypothetical protein